VFHSRRFGVLVMLAAGLCLALAATLFLSRSETASHRSANPSPSQNPVRGHVHTDGLELAAPATTSSGTTTALARPVRCIRNPSAPAFRVLYAYPRDHGSRRSSAVPVIRRSVELANGILHQSARETSLGSDVRLRVRCSNAGRITVASYPLVKSGNDATGVTFAQIVSAAKAAGFRNPRTKYVVFWDSPVTGMCGQGQLHPDERRSVENANNSGETYAALYGRSCWQGTATLHEIGHMMGAVENGAPHATGWGHCNQQHDIMCYADGGPAGRVANLTWPCRVIRFDCGHDDYFRVGATRGYLATHWNVGWTGNRYLWFGRR
jgi:hypothetical protein